MKNFYSLLCKGKCTKCTKILTILLLLTVGLLTQVQTVRADNEYNHKIIFIDLTEFNDAWKFEKLHSSYAADRYMGENNYIGETSKSDMTEIVSNIYATTRKNDYVRSFQLQMNGYYSNPSITVGSRSNNTQNCIKVGSDGWTLTWTTYVPPLYLRGIDGTPDWAASEGIKLITSDNENYTLTINLTGSDEKEFKVADAWWDQFQFGVQNTDNNKFTPSSTTQTLNNNNNVKLQMGYEGNYVFNFVRSTKVLTVYYPCKVTFNANGHGTAPAAQVVTYNQNATAPAAPEATGYVFGGWYRDVACTGTAFDFANTPVTTDITLYAKWTAESEPCTYSDFIANGTGNTANDSRYKICAPRGTLVNLQTGTGDENQPASGVEFIFLNSFSKQITACSLGEGNYTIWPGSMAIGLYLSAFNAAETTFTITDEDGDHTFRVSNERPDVTYSVTASAAAGCTISDLSGYTALRGGETVNFTVTTASGKKVTSVTMNGTALTATGVTEEGVYSYSFTMPASDVTIGVTTENLLQPRLLGRFQVRTEAGGGLQPISNNDWTTEYSNSNVPFVYNHSNGLYEIKTYASTTELKPSENNHYIYIRISDNTKYGAKSNNLPLPNEMPQDPNAQDNNGDNFHFTYDDDPELLNVVLHFDVDQLKFWYTGTPETRYTVTFNKNGDDVTGTMESGSVRASLGTYTIPTCEFKKEGYRLTGWKDQDENTYAPGAEIDNITGDLTLTAQWTAVAEGRLTTIYVYSKYSPDDTYTRLHIWGNTGYLLDGRELGGTGVNVNMQYVGSAKKTNNNVRYLYKYELEGTCNFIVWNRAKAGDDGKFDNAYRLTADETDKLTAGQSNYFDLSEQDRSSSASAIDSKGAYSPLQVLTLTAAEGVVFETSHTNSVGYNLDNVIVKSVTGTLVTKSKAEVVYTYAINGTALEGNTWIPAAEGTYTITVTAKYTPKTGEDSFETATATIDIIVSQFHDELYIKGPLMDGDWYAFTDANSNHRATPTNHTFTWEFEAKTANYLFVLGLPPVSGSEDQLFTANAVGDGVQYETTNNGVNSANLKPANDVNVVLGDRVKITAVETTANNFTVSLEKVHVAEIAKPAFTTSAAGNKIIQKQPLTITFSGTPQENVKYTLYCDGAAVGEAKRWNETLEWTLSDLAVGERSIRIDATCATSSETEETVGRSDVATVTVESYIKLTVGLKYGLQQQGVAVQDQVVQFTCVGRESGIELGTDYEYDFCIKRTEDGECIRQTNNSATDWSPAHQLAYRPTEAGTYYVTIRAKQHGQDIVDYETTETVTVYGENDYFWMWYDKNNAKNNSTWSSAAQPYLHLKKNSKDIATWPGMALVVEEDDYAGKYPICIKKSDVDEFILNLGSYQPQTIDLNASMFTCGDTYYMTALPVWWEDNPRYSLRNTITKTLHFYDNCNWNDAKRLYCWNPNSPTYSYGNSNPKQDQDDFWTGSDTRITQESGCTLYTFTVNKDMKFNIVCNSCNKQSNDVSYDDVDEYKVYELTFVTGSNNPEKYNKSSLALSATLTIKQNNVEVEEVAVNSTITLEGSFNTGSRNGFCETYHYYVKNGEAWDEITASEGVYSLQLTEQRRYTFRVEVKNGDFLLAAAEKSVEVETAEKTFWFYDNAGWGKVYCSQWKENSNVYTIVGQKGLMGSDWNVNDPENEMIAIGDGKYKLTKTVKLKQSDNYQFKVVKNHNYKNGELPRGNTNYYLQTEFENWSTTIEETETEYNIVFILDPNQENDNDKLTISISTETATSAKEVTTMACNDKFYAITIAHGETFRLTDKTGKKKTHDITFAEIEHNHVYRYSAETRKLTDLAFSVSPKVVRLHNTAMLTVDAPEGSCLAYSFDYREKGTEAWTAVGNANALSELSYSVIPPEAKTYEVRMQAKYNEVVVSSDIDELEVRASNYKTIYFHNTSYQGTNNNVERNEGKWVNVAVYVWDVGNNPTWPGDHLHPLSDSGTGADYYEIMLPTNACFIVNNNLPDNCGTYGNKSCTGKRKTVDYGMTNDLFEDGATYVLKPNSHTAETDDGIIYYKFELEKETNPAAIYQVKTTNPNGVFFSNKVMSENEILSFYVAKGGKVEILQLNNNNAVVGTYTTKYDGESGVKIARLTANHTSLQDLADYPRSDGYYIHTDGSEAMSGNWKTYNEMTDDEKAAARFNYFTPNKNFPNETYNHYWVKWIEKNKGSVDAVVGNKYNLSLAHEILWEEPYTNQQGKAIQNANVRFAYNDTTNTFTRTFMRGSTEDPNNFLRVYGTEVYTTAAATQKMDENNSIKWTDMSNWTYEATVYAKPSSSVVAYGCYPNTNTKVYYLGEDEKGDPTQIEVLGENSAVLKSGENEVARKMRLIYDYKTNRLIIAWIPETNVTIDGIDILESSMMITRSETQSNTECITVNLAADGKVTDITQVYAVFEIYKEARTKDGGFFWISLPFDCKISDIFGLPGKYREKWYIQTYLTEFRANYGLGTYNTWWGTLAETGTMKAGVGYVLKLNLEENDFTNIKNNGTEVSKLSLYFPSAQTSDWVLQNSNTLTVKYTDYECKLTGRKDKDSNWRVIGVPAYNDVTAKSFTPENGSEYWDGGNETKNELPSYVYTWDWAGGKRIYTPQSTSDALLAESNRFQFKAFHSYMAQFAGEITWNQFAETHSDAMQQAIRARERAENEHKGGVVRVDLLQGDDLLDRTYVGLQKGATAEFDNGLDLTKLGKSTSYLYTFAPAADLTTNANVVKDMADMADAAPVATTAYAANTVAVEDVVIPMGITVKTAGEYTFSTMAVPENMRVVLHDTLDNVRVDMSVDDYTVELEAGDVLGRFSIEFTLLEEPEPCDPADPNSDCYCDPTDPESECYVPVETAIDNANAEHINYWQQDGNLYLNGLNAGESIALYDMVGHVVYTGNYTLGQAIPAPQTGIYLLTVNNTVVKIAVK